MEISIKNIFTNTFIWLLIFHFTTFMLWPVPIKVILYSIVFIITIKYFLLTNRKYNIIKYDIFSLLLIIYFFYCFFNMFIMYEQIERLVYGFYEYIFYTMFMFIFLEGFSNINIRYFKNYMCFISIITSIIAIIEYIFQIYLINTEGYLTWNEEGDSIFRAMAFSTSPMTLGILLDIYIFTSIDRYIESKKKIFIFIALFNFIALLSTYSRGPLIAFIGGIIVYWLLYHKKSIGKNIIFLIIIFAIISIFMFVGDSSADLLIRFRSILDWDENASNVQRMLYWVMSLNIIFDNISNFVLGIGLASTGAMGLGVSSIMVTESGVLKRFVEGGVIMIILNYAIIGMIFFKGIKSIDYLGITEKGTCIYAIACIVSILIMDCTLQVTEDTTTSFFFWLFLAIILVITNNKNKKIIR